MLQNMYLYFINYHSALIKLEQPWVILSNRDCHLLRALSSLKEIDMPEYKDDSIERRSEQNEKQ